MFQIILIWFCDSKSATNCVSTQRLFLPSNQCFGLGAEKTEDSCSWWWQASWREGQKIRQYFCSILKCCILTTCYKKNVYVTVEGIFEWKFADFIHSLCLWTFASCHYTVKILKHGKLIFDPLGSKQLAVWGICISN